MIKIRQKRVAFVLILMTLPFIFLGRAHLNSVTDYLRQPLIKAAAFLFGFNQARVDRDNSQIDISTDATHNLRVRVELLEQENEELKEQLNFLKDKPYDSIGATVIAKSLDPLSKTINLDKGSNEGVRLDSAVVSGAGNMIGKIISVGDNTSLVRLLSDHKSRVAATVLGRDRSIGLIEGGYGLSVRMSLIPQNENVSVGDTVITSGLEENIPYGIILGTVEAVEKEAYQPFQRAVVKPSQNLEKVRLLSIVVPTDH